MSEITATEFDPSDCLPACPALCEHFESWYRAGMSAAWSQVGDGLRGVLNVVENQRTHTKNSLADQAQGQTSPSKGDQVT